MADYQAATQQTLQDLDRIRDGFMMVGRTLHEIIRQTMKFATGEYVPFDWLQRLDNRVSRLEYAGRKSGGKSGKKRAGSRVKKTGGKSGGKSARMRAGTRADSRVTLRNAARS